MNSQTAIADPNLAAAMPRRRPAWAGAALLPVWGALFLLAVLAMILISPAEAAAGTAGDLRKQCGPDSNLMTPACSQALGQIVELEATVGPLLFDRPACLLDPGRIWDLRLTFLEWTARNPGKLDMPDLQAVVAAATEASLCQPVAR